MPVKANNSIGKTKLSLPNLIIETICSFHLVATKLNGAVFDFFKQRV